MPRLSQFAHLDLDPDPSTDPPAHLLPDKVIWFGLSEDKDMTVFRVWDYRLNHSISFTVDVVEEYESDLMVCFILSKALELASNLFVGR